MSAVKGSYEEIEEALAQFEDNEDEKNEARLQARNILDKMSELEFCIMLELWSCILTEFLKVSKTLQGAEISLAVCAGLYSSLSTFIDSLAGDFSTIESKAKNRVPDTDYKSDSKRIRKRNRFFFTPSNPDDPLDRHSAQESFKLKSFDPILEALKANLSKSAEVYSFVSQTFSFLTEPDITEDVLSSSVKNLINSHKCINFT